MLVGPSLLITSLHRALDLSPREACVRHVSGSDQRERRHAAGAHCATSKPSLVGSTLFSFILAPGSQQPNRRFSIQLYPCNNDKYRHTRPSVTPVGDTRHAGATCAMSKPSLVGPSLLITSLIGPLDLSPREGALGMSQKDRPQGDLRHAAPPTSRTSRFMSKWDKYRLLDKYRQ